jgi:hypothetical protein
MSIFIYQRNATQQLNQKKHNTEFTQNKKQNLAANGQAANTN